MPLSALITQAQALSQLNDTTAEDPVELQLYIDGATSVVEREKGSIIAKPVVEFFDGAGRQMLVLKKGPILSMTSVVEDGVTLDTTDYTPYLDEGLIARNFGAWSSAGLQNVVVSYTAGRDSVDPAWQLAALIIMQHLWDTQRGTKGPVPGGGGEFVIPAGFAIPNRALELLGASIPGVA